MLKYFDAYRKECYMSNTGSVRQVITWPALTLQKRGDEARILLNKGKEGAGFLLPGSPELSELAILYPNLYCLNSSYNSDVML